MVPQPAASAGSTQQRQSNQSGLFESLKNALSSSTSRSSNRTRRSPQRSAVVTPRKVPAARADSSAHQANGVWASERVICQAIQPASANPNGADGYVLEVTFAGGRLTGELELSGNGANETDYVRSVMSAGVFKFESTLFDARVKLLTTIHEGRLLARVNGCSVTLSRRN